MTDIIQRKLFLQMDATPDASTCESITTIISLLNPYMLTINNKSITPKLNIDTQSVVVPEGRPIPEQPCISTLTPPQADSLFWCIYIAIHKYDEYLMIHNKHNMLELEWKQKLSKQITDCPSKLKQSNHKVTKANIQEILWLKSHRNTQRYGQKRRKKNKIKREQTCYVLLRSLYIIILTLSL